MQVRFRHTHAYPGCAATIAGERVAADRGEAMAEFSDGAIAAARFERSGADEMLLREAAYRTARRTPIPAKRWRLRRAGKPAKVIARLG